MITRPMLAGTVEDINALRYPLIASPKLDGIRCIIKDGKPLSRKFLEIPNRHIFDTLSKLKPTGVLDGELMVGDAFQAVTSGVMSRDGEPDFTYYVFDYVRTLAEEYVDRLDALKRQVKYHNKPFIQFVPVEDIANAEELSAYEERMLAAGYEGVMLRTPDGPYKCGRSTLKEHYLLKLKRFVDGEAVILGFEEMMHNDNEAKQDAFGNTKRSSAKAGKRAAGTLGKFLVRDVKSGIEFAIGTGRGLTAELRQEIWNARKSHVGKIVKYKSQDFGVKTAPRIPIFLGFRDPRDM